MNFNNIKKKKMKQDLRGPEVWKNIENFLGIYKISSWGRIKSVLYGKHFIMANPITEGYYRVGLTKKGKTNHFLVHRLFAIAFIPNPDAKPCINHKDGNRLNNKIENLEWCTYAENNQHAYDTGLNIKLEGEKNYSAKLKKDNIIEIRSSEMSNLLLSKQFNVSPSTIYKIKKKLAWKHIL